MLLGYCKQNLRPTRSLFLSQAFFLPGFSCRFAFGSERELQNLWPKAPRTPLHPAGLSSPSSETSRNNVIETPDTFVQHSHYRVTRVTSLKSNQTPKPLRRENRANTPPRARTPKRATGPSGPSTARPVPSRHACGLQDELAQGPRDVHQLGPRSPWDRRRWLGDWQRLLAAARGGPLRSKGLMSIYMKSWMKAG